MVELTCAICGGLWNGEIGDVDCPWCEGPNFIRITGETIVVTSTEDIDDAVETLEHDKEDVQDNLEDSNSIIGQEQEKHDAYEESVTHYTHDIDELNIRKQNWIEMGIGGDE
ncbi:MAG: hypothetical protein BA873_13750 [Desulfobulbaceae bacterium C00003063]|jgi:uncharacterized Zn finger protein (UPF0148 family)|nr:MAG: hypothetical protein BA873_13750 [Desulfobulbaceae bacterium C00003063]